MIINNIPEFLSDAFVDSIKLVPFLFVIFVLIELFETKYSKKIIDFMQYSKRFGPIIGALIAIIPQCGFSVIASTLFVKRFISAGTLLAVYIATSDEAIPVLLTDFSNSLLITKIILIKLVLAIIVGYLVDLVLKRVLNVKKDPIEIEKGCCHHDIVDENRGFLYHPIKHTFNIFAFIFITCTVLNYVLMNFGVDTVRDFVFEGSMLQPVLISLIGLIPNCSISILIVMLYLEKTITFGSLIAGLSSGAGLGLLVLLKKNENAKETALLITILFLASVLAGIILNAA
ncbi:arsenic efflux protein [bacterium]|nr:arsenic efflux protein [bacterium]